MARCNHLTSLLFKGLRAGLGQRSVALHLPRMWVWGITPRKFSE